MNKAELVDYIASNADLTKAQAAKAIDAFVGGVEAALKGGDSVTLVGFGTFSVGDREARTGRNPKTGEPLEIPASKQPKFKAGKTLKDAVQ